MVIGIQNAHEILDGHHMRCNNGTGGFHEKFPPLPPLLHPIITDFFSYGSIVKRPQLSPSRISFCIPMTISSLMFPGTGCIYIYICTSDVYMYTSCVYALATITHVTRTSVHLAYTALAALAEHYSIKHDSLLTQVCIYILHTNTHTHKHIYIRMFTCIYIYKNAALAAHYGVKYDLLHTHMCICYTQHTHVNIYIYIYMYMIYIYVCTYVSKYNIYICICVCTCV